MAIEWRLREVMMARGIGNASRLHATLEESMGIGISREALTKLLKKQPSQIRLETVQYLCTLLQVPLNELLIITPEPVIRHTSLIQPFGKKAKSATVLMVDPGNFF